MQSSTTQLVLAPDDAIDLQVHTTYSDGTWMPEQLIDYAIGEQFSLLAITDHDRTDTAVMLQQLATQKRMPVLVAVEMTMFWHGEMTDMLCFGFDPESIALPALAGDITRRQRDITREVYENLTGKGCELPDDALAGVLESPSAQQPHALVALLKRCGYEAPGKMLMEAGVEFATNTPAAVVEAAHQSGAVCLIAHPGRTDGFVCYDADLLDEFRREFPIDGIEVYHPTHTAEQAAMYLNYAQKHGLLISSGSDSHGPEKKPIKYRAELSRTLLERVGIRVS